MYSIDRTVKTSSLTMRKETSISTSRKLNETWKMSCPAYLVLPPMLLVVRNSEDLIANGKLNVLLYVKYWPILITDVCLAQGSTLKPWNVPSVRSESSGFNVTLAFLVWLKPLPWRKDEIVKCCSMAFDSTYAITKIPSSLSSAHWTKSSWSSWSPISSFDPSSL